MANSLLDFVMSLLRDPDAAARYAADPVQTISDAHLSDVTTADVNHLIPVVADQLSVAVPTAGVGHEMVDDLSGNVWASGAATAAFDAFDVPQQADHPHDLVPTVAHSVIDDPGFGDPGDAAGTPLHQVDEAALHLETPTTEAVDDVINQAAPAHEDVAGGWEHPHAGADPAGFDGHHPDPSAFDLFD